MKAHTKKIEARDRATSGDAKKAKKSLKKAIQRMKNFVHRVKSLSGRKVIPEPTRTRFLGQADPIVRDSKTLAKNL